MIQRSTITACGRTLVGLALGLPLVLALPCNGNAGGNVQRQAAERNHPAGLQVWAKNRLLDSLSTTASANQQHTGTATGCEIQAEGVSAIVSILSVTDPKTRQDQSSTLLANRAWNQFVCDFRAAEQKMNLAPATGPAALLPEVEMTGREASVQLLLQAVQGCGRCAEGPLLQTVAAGSAIKARMYPEALRLLFDLLEVNAEFRQVYESVQRSFAASHRGKGEVSLGAPR